MISFFLLTIDWCLNSDYIDSLVPYRLEVYLDFSRIELF